MKRMSDLVSLRKDQISSALLRSVLSELGEARRYLAKLYSSPNADFLFSQVTSDGRRLFTQEAEQITMLWQNVNLMYEKIERYEKVLQQSISKLDELDRSYINQVADWKDRLSYALKSGQAEWLDTALEIPSLFLPVGIASGLVTILGSSDSILRELQQSLLSNRSAASDLLHEADQAYEKLPDELKDIIKYVVGSDTVTAAQITEDLISGEADLETLEKFVDVCAKNTIEGRAVTTVADLIFHPSDNMKLLMEEQQYFQDVAIDAFSDGDILEGCKNTAVSMGVGLYTIGYGCVEAGYNMVNDIFCKGKLIDFDEVTNFFANLWK